MPVFTFEPIAASGLCYVDGGVGSVLFQAAIGGLLTFGYFVAAKWAHLREVFARAAKRAEIESE
jgi:hypothetical protein